jgi:2-polyprenyl-3-methyl-5-hydroxy-6-metoxy-1,4-benzoquinol methylase
MKLLDRFLRRVVRRGELTVTGHDGTRYQYGNPDPGREPVAIRIADRRVGFDIVRNPRLGAAEAYIDGRIVMEQGEILDLLDLVRSNARWENGGDKSPLERGGARIARAYRYLNWERRSRRNVAHHYDLSDRLYSLFLDSDRQYSCAYFTDAANGLEQAQLDKKAHIAAKLLLKPGQRVLDIGCGWGGMALYLNRVADVDVLGITLSEEQLKVARRRAEEAGVADRVRFELLDYRKVEGRFDRIVSVGMFEHVGPPHYRTFFRKCRQLLADDGVMLLHTIGRQVHLPGRLHPRTVGNRGCEREGAADGHRRRDAAPALRTDHPGMVPSREGPQGRDHRALRRALLSHVAFLSRGRDRHLPPRRNGQLPDPVRAGPPRPAADARLYPRGRDAPARLGPGLRPGGNRTRARAACSRVPAPNDADPRRRRVTHVLRHGANRC